MSLKRHLAALAIIPGLIAPAVAGESADILRNALYTGTLADGLTSLGPKAEAGDEEARFGLGVLTFFTGIEHLSQAFYRHGLSVNDAGVGPILSTPVLANPDPEPLNYEKVRGILDTLVSDMDKARDLLKAAEGDFVVDLDVTLFRVDIDGDGKAGEDESVQNILAAAFNDGSVSTPIPDPSKTGNGSEGTTPPNTAITFGFDRADAIWLAGYSQVFATQADFLLAHDFSALVNSTFHRLFPKAGLPMQNYGIGGTLMMGPENDSAIADAIAAIHTMNWPVTDAARFKGVHDRLTGITALSRQNWDAIEAETDDHAEFIPSPKQSPQMPEGAVTVEMVTAWRATLDTADQILAGDLLIPHWRFKQGFDLKAYFDGADHTDLVMLLTGYDALPFIKDGPIATAESFTEANRVFGDNLWGYVFWFN